MTFERELITLRPHLLAFARSLARDFDTAEDLVQDTLVKAIQHKASFVMGTNMKAWTFMILRNQFLSECRRQSIRNMSTLDDDEHPITVPVSGGQHEALELRQTLGIMGGLSPDMRTAVELVAMNGFSYEEAANRTAVAIGTVKSRVARGRKLLMRRIEEIPEQKIEPVTIPYLEVGQPPPVLTIRNFLERKKFLAERSNLIGRVRIFSLV